MSTEMQVINNANLLFRDINKCSYVYTALNGEKMDRKQHQEDWIAGSPLKCL